MADEHLLPEIQGLRDRFRWEEHFAQQAFEQRKVAVLRKLLDDSQVEIFEGRYQAALKILSISDQEIQWRIDGNRPRKPYEFRKPSRKRHYTKGGKS